MVRLEENKSRSDHNAIETMALPKFAYIPLSQHIGKPSCDLQVKVGDSVLLGQKLASAQARVSSPVHASLSGKITSIQMWPHPVIGRCQTIVIEGDGQDKKYQISGIRGRKEIEALDAANIRQIVREAGIVGMGGASFPTHIKLDPPKPVDTLIINGAECEPYLTGDYRLMLEKSAEIILGIELAARCLAAKKVIIAIEENKPEAIKKFSCLGQKFMVRSLKPFYPQGGEKQLIKNVLGKEVPRGKFPFDIGVSVQNVATVFALYEAVYNNKPLYERVVTVSGSCIANPKNLLVRLGTPIKELIAFCGLRDEPEKIIFGGPMMGIAQFSNEVPVIKCTTGIILMNKKEAKDLKEESCIRCGACVRECPAGLMPCLINLASEKELWQLAEGYSAADCIECGLCNYVCPANRRLVQTIKRAKLEALK